MSNSFSKEELDYLRTCSIFIATPCYGEMCSAHYAQSLAYTYAFAEKHGIRVGHQVIGNESLITRARNQMVYDFMESGYSHLMFVDADISFDKEDLFKLALYKKDVVAAAYPMKGLSWDRVIGSKTEEEARKRSVNYVVNMPPELSESKEVKETGVFKVNLYDGLLEVYDAGTGFMMISRFALQAMIDNYGDELSYTGDEKSVSKSGKVTKKTIKLHALFDTSIDLKTDRYLSEDYTFCRRWQALGGKIWIDPDIVLNHHGSYTYRGYPLMSDKD